MSDARRTNERGGGAMRLLLSVLVAFAVLLASPVSALADWGSFLPTKPITSLKGALTIYMAPNGSYLYMEFYGESNKVKALKSSDTRVLAAEESGKCTYLTPFEPGKSTVTFKYKGKKYSAKVTVLKYVSPIARVKVGSKTYRRPFKSKNIVSMKSKLFKGKTFKVTPTSGWKVVSVHCSYIAGNSAKLKKIKNGGKLPNAQLGDVFILLKNKKTGGYERVTYYFE